jgi:hypothetical protein
LRGAPQSTRAAAQESTMFDVAMLVMTGGFFAIGVLYVLACERL